ncbi:MAG: FecR domain-containing protein [Acidobacteria bacterium]|nr:FecR domain-containing protein [Acidobacteriota bacterium]
MTRNRISLAALASFLLALGLSATANAQYLVSTKAGFVNRVEGKVYILRVDSEDGEKGRASLGTQMRDGDMISVTAYGKAEVLLNPGSYLRVDQNSEVRAVNTDFSSVRFELIKGTVIAEIGEIDKKSPIEIVTPHGVLTIAKQGLHRIDSKGSVTRVAARQGEIYLGTRNDLAAKKAFKIGRGKVATLTGAAQPNKSDLAKIDKDEIDNFDKWSFVRAQSLTAANVSTLRRSGVMSAFNGGWYYDPFFNCYTFMPYRSRFFSPYGFGFFNNFRDCYYYNPYSYYGYGYGGYYGGGGGVTANIPARVVSGVDRAPIRRSAEGRGIDTNSGFDSRSGGYGDYGGSRTISSPSSSSSSSVISAPAPSRAPTGGGGGSMPSRGGRP